MSYRSFLVKVLLGCLHNDCPSQELERLISRTNASVLHTNAWLELFADTIRKCFSKTRFSGSSREVQDFIDVDKRSYSQNMIYSAIWNSMHRWTMEFEKSKIFDHRELCYTGTGFLSISDRGGDEHDKIESNVLSLSKACEKVLIILNWSQTFPNL